MGHVRCTRPPIPLPQPPYPPAAHGPAETKRASPREANELCTSQHATTAQCCPARTHVPAVPLAADDRGGPGASLGMQRPRIPQEECATDLRLHPSEEDSSEAILQELLLLGEERLRRTARRGKRCQIAGTPMAATPRPYAVERRRRRLEARGGGNHVASGAWARRKGDDTRCHTRRRGRCPSCPASRRPLASDSAAVGCGGHGATQGLGEALQSEIDNPHLHLDGRQPSAHKPLYQLHSSVTSLRARDVAPAPECATYEALHGARGDVLEMPAPTIQDVIVVGPEGDGRAARSDSAVHQRRRLRWRSWIGLPS